MFPTLFLMLLNWTVLLVPARMPTPPVTPPTVEPLKAITLGSAAVPWGVVVLVVVVVMPDPARPAAPRLPAALLAEVTLREVSVPPPAVLFGPAIATPAPPFATAISPVESVPMKFPATALPDDA